MAMAAYRAARGIKAASAREFLFSRKFIAVHASANRNISILAQFESSLSPMGLVVLFQFRPREFQGQTGIIFYDLQPPVFRYRRVAGA